MIYYDIYDGDTFICRYWYLGMVQKVLKDRPYLTVRREGDVI